MNKFIIILSFVLAILISCQRKQSSDPILPERQEPKIKTYYMANAKQWLADSTIAASHLEIVYAVNRTDDGHFEQMDSVVIPDDMSGDLVFYLPFPHYVPYLKDVHKIVFFSYPTQVFAAYENGILMYTGPTNMGSKNHPTPAGLYHTNWKAEETISTFDDEWELFWNFNVENLKGIGWHQYELPGYPASHSCLRMLEKDAKFMYNWADEWVLSDKDEVMHKGTPVIVFGTYNFDGPKPWLQLVTNPKALDISEEEIKIQTAPHLQTILADQRKRENKQAKK
jgi:hypothetical protein